MANPKYSDLPGIAVDQPDVYETNELPESDQINIETVDESESVEKLVINANESYGKFKDKLIDSSTTDFSDKISKSRRTGYEVQSGDWEMLGSKCLEKETPEQKYQRLKHEFNELLQDIDQLKDDAKNDSLSSTASPASLSTDVVNMQKELLDLNLERSLGAEIMASLSDPNGALKKKLFNQLDDFKSKRNESANSQSSEEKADGDCITYQLYCKPELTKHTEATKIAEFEQRLQKLESLIGKDVGKLASIVGEVDHKNLVTAVRNLGAKLVLLDPSQLDVIETRLQNVAQKLNQIGEKKSTIEEGEKMNKVSQLYDIMKENECMVQSLPEIVDRMVCLEELHRQALQFSQALTELDNVQQHALLSMKNSEKQLKIMEDNFEKNMQMIKENITNLESRIEKVKK